MGETQSLKEYLVSAEAKKIREVLRRTGGNVTKAAVLLDVTEQTLYKKCRKLGIKPMAYRPENIEAAKEALELDDEEQNTRRI